MSSSNIIRCSSNRKRLDNNEYNNIIIIIIIITTLIDVAVFVIVTLAVADLTVETVRRVIHRSLYIYIYIYILLYECMTLSYSSTEQLIFTDLLNQSCYYT